MGKLDNAIQSEGGKIGILRLLRDEYGFDEAILPHVLIGTGEKITEATRSAITLLGADQLIVRSSNSSDYRGMVDAMPTRVCNGENVEPTIEEVFQLCTSPYLAKYSEIEGSGYSPNHVTVSVTPYMPNLLSLCTVTEHPNQDEVFYIDFGADFSHDHRPDIRYESHNIDREHNISHRLNGSVNILPQTNTVNHEILTSVMHLRDRVRETGLFDDGEALQLELGLRADDKLHPLLFQVRHFAPRQSKASFRISSYMCNLKSARVFGKTPQEGITLPISSDFNVFEASRRGDEEFQSGYILHPEWSAMRLGLNCTKPQHMGAYVPGAMNSHVTALGHNQTRYAQWALQQNNGVVVLAIMLSDIPHGETLTVVSDGLNAKFEKK